MTLLETAAPVAAQTADIWSQIYVFVLATFIGLGVIRRVSRLLHTPLIALVTVIAFLIGTIAVFASMTNIVSGFLITERMLKMFKTEPRTGEGPRS